MSYATDKTPKTMWKKRLGDKGNNMDCCSIVTIAQKHGGKNTTDMIVKW